MYVACISLMCKFDLPYNNCAQPIIPILVLPDNEWEIFIPFPLFLLEHSHAHHDFTYSDGKLVVIGGVALDQNKVPNLVPMQQVLVFDTKSNTWTAQNTQASGGTYPSTRTDHSAVVSKYSHANNA